MKKKNKRFFREPRGQVGSYRCDYGFLYLLFKVMNSGIDRVNLSDDSAVQRELSRNSISSSIMLILHENFRSYAKSY